MTWVRCEGCGSSTLCNGPLGVVPVCVSLPLGLDLYWSLGVVNEGSKTTLCARESIGKGLTIGNNALYVNNKICWCPSLNSNDAMSTLDKSG